MGVGKGVAENGGVAEVEGQGEGESEVEGMGEVERVPECEGEGVPMVALVGVAVGFAGVEWGRRMLWRRERA